VTDQEGRQSTFLGFQLEKGEVITAPIEGYLAHAMIKQPSPFRGEAVRLGDVSIRCPGPTVTLLGDVIAALPPEVSSSTDLIRTGAPIATVTGDGAAQPGGYNVLLALSGDDGGRALDTTDLQWLFPLAFTKVARDVPYDGKAYGVLFILADNGQPCRNNHLPALRR
jgi:hypothetical protein